MHKQSSWKTAVLTKHTFDKGLQDLLKRSIL